MPKSSRGGRLVAESLVVIVSILLAFAIDAWWADRSEGRLEAEYVVALSDQIEQALSETQADLDGRRDQEVLLRAFLDHAPLPNDSLQLLLQRMSRISNIAPPTAVLDELIATGRLQILRSAELREGLMAFRQMLDKIELNEESQRAFVHQRLMPYLSTNLPYLSTNLPLTPILLREPARSVLLETGTPDASELQADERFQNLMVERLYLLQRGLPRIESTVDLLGSLVELLRSARP